MKTIKHITKQEALEMRKVLGKEQVKKSKSRHPKYYLVETKYNLAALFEYQKSKIIETRK